MGQWKEFVKKNTAFVMLCIAFLAISLSLIGYKLITSIDFDQPSELSKPGDKQPSQKPSEEKNPEIIGFHGEYDDQNGEVTLTWDVDNKDGKLNTLSLYYIRYANTENEREIYVDDVTNYANYHVLQSVYGLTTGENTFKLKATYDQGETIEKTTTVSLPMILSMSQNEEMKVNGEAEIKLTYVYGKQHPVQEPAILNLATDMVFSYEKKDLKLTENGDFIIAELTYVFRWNPSMQATPFTIRWYFQDIQKGQDFITDLKLK